MHDDMVTSARRLAEELLLPAANATDRSPLLAREPLDAFAAAGLYGLAGPDGLGGGGPLPPGGHLDVIEALAGGCLTTTFVWLQHHGAVLALDDGTPAELRDRWLAPLCRGDVRAGAAFSGLRGRSGPSLVATAVADGWRLDGTAPWVSGWGRVDVIRAAGCDAGGTIVWALVDAVQSATLQATPLALVAMGASGTVRLTFDGHVVPADRVLSRQPLADWIARDGAAPTLQVTAALAFGIAARACALRGPSEHDEELGVCRAELAEAGGAGDQPRVAAGRAWAIDLAVRAAHALLCDRGGRALLLDEHGQRLAREALFLLVFAQSAELRDAQLRQAAAISGERIAAGPALAVARRGRPAMAGEGSEPPLVLDPRALVELWERQRWNPRDLDLRRDRAGWAAIPLGLRERLRWHVDSFFVGEHRVAAELGALIRASESTDEAAFLATQQLDEVRHAEHFDRFYRDVVGRPGGMAQHVAEARRGLGRPLVALLDERLTQSADRLAREPGDSVAKVEFVTIYHMVIEGMLALTGQRLLLDVLDERDLLPAWREGLRLVARDEHRHIAYGAWLLREKAAEPALAARICALLDELVPLAADVLVPPGARPERFRPLGRSGAALRRDASSALERRMRAIGVRPALTLAR